MAAKFLCCLPLRFGVIVISFIQFLLSAGVGGLLWWALWYVENHDDAEFTPATKTTTIIVASIYTFAAAIGLFGFLGAVFKKNKLVKTFYILLCLVFGLQVGGSIWYLVTFYRSRGQTLEDCIKGSTDQTKIAFCNALETNRKIPQGLMIASAIIPILVQAYACYIVHNYSKRLTKQKADKMRQTSSFVVPPSGPTYQPVSRTDESYPLTQPIATYPYADNANAFGHTHNKSVDGPHHDPSHKV